MSTNKPSTIAKQQKDSVPESISNSHEKLEWQAPQLNRLDSIHNTDVKSFSTMEFSPPFSAGPS